MTTSSRTRPLWRSSHVSICGVMALVLALSACESKGAKNPPTPENPANTHRLTDVDRAADIAGEKSEVDRGTFDEASIDAPGRIVGVGDVHGDFDALMRSLQIGALVDDDGKWIGDDATLVQTGDLLDRGDDEQKIVDYLHALRNEAEAAGGKVVLLAGNHEVMNVAGDLRYVTKGGFTDFEDVEGLDLDSPVLQRIPDGARPRMAAFMPGGPYAEKLAGHRIIAIVDDTVFAHGGVLPHHVEFGIDEINAQASAWMRGDRDPPMVLQGEHAPTWTRAYSGASADCETLTKTLDALDAERLVVGHTVQRDGITSACAGKVWRIDVGMSAHYGGSPAALQIRGDEVTPLSASVEE